MRPGIPSVALLAVLVGAGACGPGVKRAPVDAAKEIVRQQVGPGCRALLRAGAHCIVIFDPVASPAVLPLSLFVNYEFPRLKRMCPAFRSAGAPVSWISIAGAPQKIMPYFSRAGINLATVDYVVPLPARR